MSNKSRLFQLALEKEPVVDDFSKELFENGVESKARYVCDRFISFLCTDVNKMTVRVEHIVGEKSKSHIRLIIEGPESVWSDTAITSAEYAKILDHIPTPPIRVKQIELQAGGYKFNMYTVDPEEETSFTRVEVNDIITIDDQFGDIWPFKSIPYTPMEGSFSDTLAKLWDERVKA